MQRILLLFSFLITAACLLGQTSLSGTVVDAGDKSPIFLANVAIYKGTSLITGTETDENGIYSLSGLDAGTFDVEVTYLGYQTQRITGVVIFKGKANKLNIELANEGVQLEQVVVKEYKVPLIQQDNTTQGSVVTGEQIKNLPIRNINTIAATGAGVSSIDGGAVSIRGSRTDATDYYIDGIRVSGSSALVPETEIEQLQLITGGLEAQYGDVAGGVISLTTKGPSDRTGGQIDIESSHLFDSYENLLMNAAISGPLMKNAAKNRTLLGYRFSGRYSSTADEAPPFTGVWVGTDQARLDLQQNPITQFGTAFIPTAEFLKNDPETGKNVATLEDHRPDAQNSALNITGRVDARLSNSIDVSFGGTFIDERNQFNPGGWNVWNSNNNPTSFDKRIRTNFRFRHKIGANLSSAGEQKRSSLIQNVSYILTGGFENFQRSLEDPNHGSNFFDYGHIGRFSYQWLPSTGVTDDSTDVQPFPGVFYGQTGYAQTFQGVDLTNSRNPVLSRYNNPVLSTAERESDFLLLNGVFPSIYTSAWGMHTNVGVIYNLFQKRNEDIVTASLQTNFDILPGGSDKGRHSIQFGIWHEQRTISAYSLAPRRLWELARLQANRHITGLSSEVIGKFGPTNPQDSFILFQAGADSFNLKRPITVDLPGKFYKKVREKTGQALDEYVNVDGLDPNELSLNMFGAQELNDLGIVNYYGYDYLGNRQGDVSFNDFFTATDADGVRSFPIAPFAPIYSAAYIQDKFQFKDIILRLGLRVDRFDANTKVLKDPFSLYDVMSAKDFYAAQGQNVPTGIGEDYKVYVQKEGSTAVKAFRNGEQWYFSDGSSATDGNVIFGGEVVTPQLYDGKLNPNFSKVNDIQSPDFDPDVNTFQDYEVQVNYAPRVALSFPISDDANFFAHYDILVQRPRSNTETTALNYFYFNVQGRTPENNPNLKPERTVDYEVGFKTRVTNTSAITISTYYKELRDMIQNRTLLYIPAPVSSYNTYANIDFGTVKGFSFNYDLRRTGNVTMTANYLLQFADGTGSDANSQRGLTSRGNIRNLFPLNYDERHTINIVLDYRYDSGKRYNGPRLFGKDIFANAGVNMITSMVSGRPYTAEQTPQRFGGAGFKGVLNGSRYPWRFNIDMRVDKQFNLTKPDAKKQLGMNVFFRVQNLLNSRNVIGVYSASGSPDDDGYLVSQLGQEEITGIQGQLDANGNPRDVQPFLDSYQWALLNPGFFTLPRRMFIGAIFTFN